MAGGRCIALVALTLLTLAVDFGAAQTFCFNFDNFICAGPSETRDSGQECCAENFLSFRDFDSDICNSCSDNVICHSGSRDCSDDFGSTTQPGTPSACCASGGMSFQDSTGQCLPCFSCNSEASCGGNDLFSESVSTPEECCLNSPGLSYRIEDQPCAECVVYGFLQDNLTESERGQGHPVNIGYRKRPDDFRTFIRGDVSVAAGGTASASDFSLSSTTFTIGPGRDDNVLVTFRVDSIAQELDETAQLQLSITTTAPAGPGVFFRDTLDLTIRDSDIVMFQLTENDYRATEPELNLTATVNKNLRIANPVTFQLFPYTVAQAEALDLIANETDPPDTLKLMNVPLDDNRFSPNRAQIEPEDRRDFSPEVITVRFEADEFSETQQNDMPAIVPITNDIIDEADEEVFVVNLVLSNSIAGDQGIMITRPSSLCRIADDDEIRIGFQNASYTFPEPEFEFEGEHTIYLEKQDGQLTEQTYVVVLEISDATPDQSIQSATLSSGGMNNDFVITSEDVTSILLEFPPEDQLLGFTFQLFPDSLPEGPEAFQASSSPSEGLEDPDFTAPTTLFASTFIVIADDDNVTIGFEQNYTVSESDGQVQVCIRVFNPPDDQPLPLQIDLLVDSINGTAQGGSDFQQIQSSQLDVFLSLNDVQRRDCFDVTIFADTVYEDTETFSLELIFDELVSGNTRSQTTIEPARTTITVQDSSSLPIGFLNAPYSATESDGFVSFMVGVTDSAVALDREVTVDFSTLGLSNGGGRDAIDGIDYNSVSDRVLTFSSSVRSVTVDVQVRNDQEFELTKSFGGSLSNSASFPRLTLSPDSAMATILDDDVLSFGYETVSIEGGESDGPVEASVTLDGDLGEFDLIVQYETRDLGSGAGFALAGSDYSSDSSSLEFASGDTVQSHEVEILSDNLAEGLETFGLRLSGFSLNRSGEAVVLATQESDRITFSPTEATVEISDDDTAVIGFLQSSYRAEEGDGFVDFTFGVLEGDLAVDVDVVFGTIDGTALAGQDYTTTSGSFTLTGRGTASQRVNITNDDIYEVLRESFQASLSSGAGLPDFVTLNPNMARGDIDDDDSLTIGFSASSYDVAENAGPASLEVAVLDGEIADGIDIAVSFSTADGSGSNGAIATEDYNALTMDLTFSSGALTRQVSVDIIDDEAFELDEFFMGNLVLLGGVERVTVSPSSAVVNIQDQDALTIGFQPVDYTVIEGQDTSVSLVARILGGTLGRDLSIDFATEDGTAIAGSDYGSVSRSLLFQPGIDNIPVAVPIMDNGAVEPEESFSGLLSIGTAIDRLTIAPERANIVIQDTDRATIGFDQSEYDVLENARFSNVTIRLTGVISMDVVIRVTTSDDSAVSIGSEPDFVAHDMLYTFTVGGPSEIVVPIRILDDGFLENDEGLSSIIALSTTSDAIDLSPAEATIRIIDDDNVVIGFERTMYEVTEGEDANAMLVVRVLMGELRRDVVVNFQTEDITALDGSDYTGVSQVLTFNQESSSTVITVPISDDDINEVLERFTGRLTSSDGDVILSPDTTTVSITDNDAVQVSFQEPIYMFNEGQGTATVCVDKIGSTTQTISVMVSGPLQAETGMRIDQIVTFAPTEFEQCVDFTIVDDNITLEETETLTWNLTVAGDPELVELGENPTTDILILDDDVLTLSVRKGDTVPESAGVAETCIVFSNPFAREFQINRDTMLAPNVSIPGGAGLAEPGSDYDPLSGSITARPMDGDAGELCFNVTIIDDEVLEEAQDCFGVTVSLPIAERDSIVLNGGATVCCIQDDDTVTIGFDPIVYNTDEDAGSVSLRVRLISGELGRPIEAFVTTSEGTATSTAPMDFINPGTITLQFDSVDQEQFAVISIVNDDIFENVENFFADLVSLDSAVMVGPDQAQVNILEDEADRPTIGFVPETIEAMEGQGDVSFNVEVISGTLERDVIVTFSTQSGTATEEAPEDYTGTTMTLTFSSSVTRISVPVAIIDDDIVEGDEQFTGNLALVNPDEAFLNPDVATVTISGEEPNDNVTIGFDPITYDVNEGDGSVTLTVRVLSGELERPIQATVTTEDGTATSTAPDDYTNPGTVNLQFDSSTLVQTVTIPIIDDDIFENVESFFANLASDDSAVIVDADSDRAVVNIAEDPANNDRPTIGFVPDAINATEGQGDVSFNVEVISGTLERDVVVTFSTQSGTATEEAPEDYTGTTMTLTFSSSVTRISVPVAIIDDDIVEGDEQFTGNLAIGNPDDATLAPSVAMVTISGDEPNDVVVIGLESNYTVNEGSTQEVCAVLISGTLERDAVVSLSTVEGTATAGSDFDALSVDLTFDAATSRACAVLSTTTDNLVEGLETLSLQLTTSDTSVTLNPDSSTVSIVEDDMVVIGFDPITYNVNEGDGSVTLTVRVLSGELERSIQATVTTEDGTATSTAPEDYTNPGTVNLQFDSSTLVQTVTIPIIDDDIFENAENFFANLASDDSAVMVDAGRGRAVVNIAEDPVNNDRPTIGFVPDAINATEGQGDVSFNVEVISGTLERDVVVTFSTQSGTATEEAPEDYTGTTRTLTFSSSVSRISVPVAIIDDDIVEGDEQFTGNLAIDNPDDATLAPSVATVTISGDEPNDSVVIGLERDYTVNEGSTQEVCAVLMSGILERDAVVSLSTVEGTATAGDDFAALSVDLTFNADISRACTVLSTATDNLVEGSETLSLELNTTDDSVTLNPDTSTVTIVEDDMVVIGFDPITYDVDEGDGSVTLTVRVLSGELERPIQATVTTEDGTATSSAPEDYTNPGTVNLQFDSSTLVQTVTIPIIDDDIFENVESFFANLASDDSAVMVDAGRGRAVVNIAEDPANNDRPIIGFVPETINATEGQGDVSFNVEVINGTLERDVIVTFSTQSGTATEEAPEDYTGTTMTLTFSSSVTRISVPVAIIDDDIVEGDEQFTGNLAIDNPDDATLAPSVATVTISGDEPNDAVVIGLESNYTVNEGSTQEVCAVLMSGTLERDAVVSLSTVEGTATAGDDFAALSVDLTFNAGTGRACADLSTATDNLVEGPETLTLELSTTDDSVTLNPDTSTVTIVEDDMVVIGFDPITYDVNEGDGSVTLTVRVLSGELERPIQATVTAEDGTATSTAPEDYTNPGTVNLQFDSSTLVQTVTIPIIDDNIFENIESFFANLASDDSAVMVDAGRGRAVVNIAEDPANNDRPIIGFVPETINAMEGQGDVSFNVEVISGTLERDVVVTFSTQSGTATEEAPEDYTGTTRTLTFSSSVTQISVPVAIINDDIVEGDEQFTGNLAIDNPDDATLAPSVATVTISGDEPNDVVVIGLESNYTVNEGSTLEVCAVLISGTLERDAVVSLSTVEGTATAGSDFDALAVDLTFNAGISRACADLSTTTDTLVEGSETLSLQLTTSDTSVNLNPDSSTVTIVEDDMIIIGLVEVDVSVNEDDGFVEVCAEVISGDLQRPVSFSLVSADGTATAPADYVQLSGTFEFMQAGNVICGNVTIVDDTFFENDETFTVTLETDDPQSMVQPDRSVATVTIADEDELTIGFVTTMVSVSESTGSVELCARLLRGDANLQREVVVTAQATDGSANAPDDYELAQVELTFDRDNLERCVNVTIVMDSVTEGVETFTVNIVNSGNIPRLTLDPDQATITIMDANMVVIGYLDQPYSFSEDGDAVVRVAVVSGTLSEDLVVNFQTEVASGVDNAAIGGGVDYQSVNVNITFNAGNSNQSITIPLINDNIDELNEIFNTRITILTEGLAAMIENNQPVASVEIVDNDDAIIGFEQEVYITQENVTSEVCAVLAPGSPQLGREVVVTVSSSDGSAQASEDYDSVSEMLTFGPGVDRQCVEVITTEDDVVEGAENFTLTITTTDVGIVINPNVATVIIEEDDVVRVMFEQPTYTFTESGVTGSVVVVRSGATDEPFMVRVQGGPSVQTNIERSADGVDEIITFEAGSGSSNRMTVTFSLTDDTVALEDIETYIASLTIIGNPDNVQLGMISSTVINVVSDDVATIDFGRPSVTVTEGEDSVFMMCVTVDRRAIQDIVVNLEARDGSAVAPGDYDAVSIPSSVTIPAGDDRICFNGSIVDDLLQEDTESFTLVITGTTPEGVNIGQNTTTIIIEDNEDATVRFEQSIYRFTEDVGTGEVCLIKDLMTTDEVTVTVNTMQGSATDGTDYIGGPFSVTFAPSANDRQCIRITIVSDTVSEPSESFTAEIVVTPGSGVSPGTPSSTTIIISDSGVQVNDTAIGDPLMTVPILVSPQDLSILGADVDQVSLCYEIHGRSDQYFNLVTDQCTSVNAYYTDITSFLNVIGRVGVRARDNNDQCRNILVDVDGCTASVDGVAINGTFASGGISVRRYSSRVRISVPNCNDLSLVMWVFCESRTLDDPEAPGGVVNGDMIKFVVMRGLNFGHSAAHGLIGQFWNVPARVSEFTGVDINGAPQPNRYVINVTGRDSGVERSFTGWFYPLTWEFEDGPCFYVGNRQGGPIQEVAEPNDPVIEGTYKDYRVQSAFSEEDYTFSQFDEQACSPEIPA